MALSPEDMQAIGQMLDQRLQAQDQKIQERLDHQERRRRRFWSWIIWLTVIATIVSSIFGAYAVKRLLSGYLNITQEIQQQQTEFAQMRMEYNRQLALDKDMQKQRADAVAKSGYTSGQSQGQFDASLLAKTMQLFNTSREASERMKEAQKKGVPDQADDEKSLGDLSQSLDQASSLMMQLLLHESDPAQEGSAEKILHKDSAQAQAQAKPPHAEASPTTSASAAADVPARTGP